MEYNELYIERNDFRIFLEKAEQLGYEVDKIEVEVSKIQIEGMIREYLREILGQKRIVVDHHNSDLDSIESIGVAVSDLGFVDVKNYEKKYGNPPRFTLKKVANKGTVYLSFNGYVMGHCYKSNGQPVSSGELEIGLLELLKNRKAMVATAKT